jgi:hypothetical protein
MGRDLGNARSFKVGELPGGSGEPAHTVVGILRWLPLALYNELRMRDPRRLSLPLHPSAYARCLACIYIGVRGYQRNPNRQAAH